METYDGMTHWGHDTMSTLVECSLDQPFLSNGNSDDRADPRMGNSVIELSSVHLLLQEN
jgi:hypothetical protein